MLIRSIVTIVNMAAFGVAIAFQFLYPSVALPVFYGLLGWYVASIVVYRLPFMSRPVGSATATSASGNALPSVGPTATTPLPLAAGGTPSDFCVFCAAKVEPGTLVCPSCGKPIPTF